MASAIVIDLSLVLILEFSRSAIATAIGPNLNTLQRLHVGFSTLAVALYIPVIILGWRMLYKAGSATGKQKKWHRRLGYAAFTARTMSFLFMFSMLDRHAQ